MEMEKFNHDINDDKLLILSTLGGMHMLTELNVVDYLERDWIGLRKNW